MQIFLAQLPNALFLLLGLAVQALRRGKEKTIDLQKPGNAVLLSCTLGKLRELVNNKLKQLSSNNVHKVVDQALSSIVWSNSIKLRL